MPREHTITSHSARLTSERAQCTEPITYPASRRPHSITIGPGVRNTEHSLTSIVRGAVVTLGGVVSSPGGGITLPPRYRRSISRNSQAVLPHCARFRADGGRAAGSKELNHYLSGHYRPGLPQSDHVNLTVLTGSLCAQLCQLELCRPRSVGEGGEHAFKN